MSQSLPMNSVIMTLAVATLGRTDEVIRLFDSLALQKNNAFEVILADQNQDNRLVPVVQNAIDMGMNITHIRLDKPDQYAARTAGIERAQGRYIAFPDDDCWYEPDTIDLVIHVFENSGADGLVGRWREVSGEKESKEGILLWEEARNFRSDGTSMITQFYRRDAVLAVGGFDTRMGLGCWFGGGEDTDMLFSVIRKGMKVILAPRIVVRHDIFPENKPNLEKIRSRARGAGALYVKHNIPPWVIFRGFVAPVLRPIFRLHFGQSLVDGLMLSLGRIEGYFKWKFGQNE